MSRRSSSYTVESGEGLLFPTKQWTPYLHDRDSVPKLLDLKQATPKPTRLSKLKLRYKATLWLGAVLLIMVMLQAGLILFTTFGRPQRTKLPIPHLNRSQVVPSAGLSPLGYTCPSSAQPRPTFQAELGPLEPLLSSSPLFDISIAYSPVVCHQFRIVIARKRRRTCRRLAEKLRPGADFVTDQYIKTKLGPDAFQLRFEGAERLVIDTPSHFDVYRCEWQFDVSLNSVGPAFLEIIHQYRNYEAFMEREEYHITRLLQPLFDEPTRLQSCPSSCGPDQLSLYPHPPSRFSLLPTCSAVPNFSGAFVPTSLQADLPLHRLPITSSRKRPTQGMYGFTPQGCTFSIDPSRPEELARCTTTPHRALLVGDSHARQTFDLIKHWLEGGAGNAESFKAESKSFSLNNLHLEFLCSPFLDTPLFCDYIETFDSITVSTGAHQACYHCPTTAKFAGQMEDIFTSWPRFIAACPAAKSPKFVYMTQPAWEPQKKEEVDCRTGQRLELWNEKVAGLARSHGWGIVDFFTRSRPHARDTQLIDGVHYLLTDAMKPVGLEYIDRIGICGD